MQPFNKYYPPDWTPDKGSINKYQGKHALGDRARKLDEGILIVRFELPFNIWCNGCDNHIGQGVRYNAQKKQIGKYYSTPILQFRMKCHLCDNWIEIQTDPKNTQYVVASGARKKVEEWEPEENEVLKIQDADEKEKLESDPMYRLEHGIKDKQVISEATPHLTQLQELNNTQWSDPYTRSQQLRKRLREDKKKIKEAETIRDKFQLNINVLPESDKDLIEAKTVDFRSTELIEKQKLNKAVAPLFTTNSNRKGTKPSLTSTSTATPTAAAEQLTKLSTVAKLHTRAKLDPFYNTTKPFTKLKKGKEGRPKNDHRDKDRSISHDKEIHGDKTIGVTKRQKTNDSTATSHLSTTLVLYTDSDTDTD